MKCRKCGSEMVFNPELKRYRCENQSCKHLFYPFAKRGTKQSQKTLF